MNFLITFFEWLLATSVRASLLTVAVLIVQALLHHRIPARWRYALWLPVLLVLLTPIFPESRWSVATLIQSSSMPMPFATTMMEQNPALDSILPAEISPASASKISWQQWACLVWGAGAASLIFCSLGAFLRTIARIKRNRIPTDGALLDEIGSLSREIGLRRPPHVWMSSMARSPAVTGFLRPTLLLPEGFSETLTPHEARHVLRHELMHIKRGDLPINSLLCLLLALHWFNPLLWIACFKARLDREAACDAQVLEHGEESQRKAYGHTLLKVQSAFSQDGLSLGFAGILQRGFALRSRILSITKQTTQHPLMKTTLSLLIVILAFLGITTAAQPGENFQTVDLQAKIVELAEDAVNVMGGLSTDKSSINSVLGVLGESQSGDLLKKIKEAKGIDILTSPKATVKDGQLATIEIGRDFNYTDANGKPDKKWNGVSITADVQVKNQNNGVDLELSLQILEFEGMVKDEKSKSEQPVFSTRKLTEHVSMNFGQTVVLQFPSAVMEKANGEPYTGQVSTKNERTGRKTFVFLTARLSDSQKGAAAPSNHDAPIAVGADSISIDKAAEVIVFDGVSEIRTSQDSITKETDNTPSVGRIVIPQVEFRDATLSEVFEFLRGRTRELDSEKKGMKILVVPSVAAQSKVTLQLKDVSAQDLLKFITKVAGCQLTMDGDIYVISPQKSAN